MDPCTVETGLLRKTPCGHASVAKCANCERPLCSKHAIAQVSAANKHTGAFMCAECNVAQREHAKRMGAVARKSGAAPSPPVAKQPAEQPKPPAVEPSGSIEYTPDSTKK